MHEDGKTIRVTFLLKANKDSGMIDIYAHELEKMVTRFYQCVIKKARKTPDKIS